MNCYLRDEYCYDYIKYDTIENLKRYFDPVSVSELEDSAIVHLVEIGKPNINVLKGQYIVITMHKGTCNYEIYNENEFDEKFYTDEELIEEDNIIHIERDVDANILWIKRRPTEQEKKDYAYIERDEKGIPIINEEPWGILEYKGDIYPVYSDDYGQQDFIILDDEIFGGGAYNLGADYDFIDKIDSWLEKSSKKEK